MADVDPGSQDQPQAGQPEEPGIDTSTMTPGAHESEMGHPAGEASKGDERAAQGEPYPEYPNYETRPPGHSAHRHPVEEAQDREAHANYRPRNPEIEHRADQEQQTAARPRSEDRLNPEGMEAGGVPAMGGPADYQPGMEPRTEHPEAADEPQTAEGQRDAALGGTGAIQADEGRRAEEASGGYEGAADGE